MLKWIAASVGAVALAAGLLLFEPWRAFTSSEVDEAAPMSERLPATAAPSATGSPATAPRQDRVLSTGEFVDAEHGTDGTAKVLELADGRRFLRLEGLSTSDGPDLHVWLSDGKPGGSWGKYDDDEYLRLGKLKATNGNQNYRIPDGADLSRYRSAVIWCDRFNVAFGTAPVRVAQDGPTGAS
ncbi:hypothetical protein ABIE44_001978 [Marmoricola sp. OAE513]|uniref:DM13 domain-containing protein n=1 Tax=Marmoricola sp. OAE513 TaxID=2817894 RepID=UPI001AE167D7